MACVVCLDDDKESMIMCMARCSTSICITCMNRFLDVSEQEDLMPRCPNQECKSEYTRAVFRELGKEQLEKYDRICYAELIARFKNQSLVALSSKNIIQKIRSEHFEFINRSFPKTISFVANNVLQHKIRTFGNRIKKKLVDKPKGQAKACPDAACQGVLDDWKCCTCNSEFCNRCERQISENHTCRQEDIQSVELMRSMVQCPTCSVPVEKIDGCNNITCAVCKTNFPYDFNLNTSECTSSIQNILTRLEISNHEAIRKFIETQVPVQQIESVDVVVSSDSVECFNSYKRELGTRVREECFTFYRAEQEFDIDEEFKHVPINTTQNFELVREHDRVLMCRMLLTDETDIKEDIICTTNARCLLPLLVFTLVPKQRYESFIQHRPGNHQDLTIKIQKHSFVSEFEGIEDTNTLELLDKLKPQKPSRKFIEELSNSDMDKAAISKKYERYKKERFRLQIYNNTIKELRDEYSRNTLTGKFLRYKVHHLQKKLNAKL